MSATPASILKKYWGYDSFREKQLEIINEVLQGDDVLALLPTGGGKSICFQVPALCSEGICVVVSPLIALMKDQVANLNARGIKAIAIHAGMQHRQIDTALDNCIYDKEVKFLYLSPERLRSELAQVRLKMMNVNLLAVDEAHCISQWGYDFRPPYLQIAETRELWPNVPVMALTATATPQVVEDIQEKLRFKRQNVIRKSFHRSNLAYMLIREDNVKGRMLRILERITGSSVVYLRNRRGTRSLAEFLQSQGVSATYYHAGVPHDERQKRQQDWLNGNTRVIVATNAFGMGIDKPDVRSVIHIGFPDSLEAYFQEAGRAGRDGESSYAVALINGSHVRNLKAKSEQQPPSREEIRNIYFALGSFFQLAEGSGEDVWFEFDIATFANRYPWKPKDILQAISLLEKADLLLFTANADPRSTVQLISDSETVYDFSLRNPKAGKVTKTLLRSYGRLFEEAVPINEKRLAKRAGMNLGDLVATLHRLQELNMMEYRPSRGLPRLTFVGGRVRKQDIHIPKNLYEDRIRLNRERIGAAIHFIQTDNVCRSQMLLKYFGETKSTHCGKCDVCRQLNNEKPTPEQLEMLLDSLAETTSIESLLLSSEIPERTLLKGLQYLLDENQVVYDMNGHVSRVDP